jgi:hypothetical protein
VANVPGSTQPSRWHPVIARSEAIVANPLFAYGAVIVVQLRAIWDVWRYKDFTFGDSAAYFTRAAEWANHLKDDVVWSPLYTNYWGTILAVVGDVYVAAMVHRIGIVLAAALLVLALLRRLLEPPLALVLALWWVVLPPTYDVLYEVHLFGILPVLVAALVVARSPGRVPLAIAFAVLAGATLLLRNELAIATLVMGVAIVIHELRAPRVDRGSLGEYVRAYGVPLAVVGLLLIGAYWRSYIQGDTARSVLRDKHNLNVCQIYAFNYQQRHPTRFLGNPFIHCRPLMEETFGRPLPSFLQATLANPRAMADYVAWNGRLLPTGLQVSLFGATVTRDDPDYVPVEGERLYPLVLSVALVALLIAGWVVMRRDREYWRSRLTPAAWVFVVLGSVALTTLVVVLMQRPRPEYMYGLVVAVLVAAGLCASALVRRWSLEQLTAPAALGVVGALALGLSSHYQPDPRPLHDGVERLEAVRGLLQGPGSVLVTARDGFGLCSYLARGHNAHCSAPSPQALASRVEDGRSLGDVLDAVGATVVYDEAWLRADPAFAPLLAAPETFGWRRVAGGTGPEGPWGVLVRDG